MNRIQFNYWYYCYVVIKKWIIITVDSIKLISKCVDSNYNCCMIQYDNELILLKSNDYNDREWYNFITTM